MTPLLASMSAFETLALSTITPFVALIVISLPSTDLITPTGPWSLAGLRRLSCGVAAKSGSPLFQVGSLRSSLPVMR